MLNGSSKSRETLKEFLRKRVESHPGISIQKLTGHLSQLPADIRAKYGGNVDSIRRVLEQFPEIFIIRNHDQVHVVTSKPASTRAASSSGGGSDDETTVLTNAKGKVYRMFKTYGFISVQQPISTSVYFSLRSFENGQHSSLLTSGLQLGDGVTLDAEAGPNDCEAKFRASRVTRIKGAHAAAASEPSSPAPQNNGHMPLVNRVGAIETLKDEFGFIKLEKEQECAFFHAAEIERYLGSAVPALPEVLAVGDKVRFDADLNKNTTARAKWVVTNIHTIQNMPPCNSGSETDGSEIAPGTLIKRDGLIQMVKPEFGFIKFGTNYRDRAFFHLNNVAMPPRDTIKSLPDVFTINDRVRFEAKPSQKPSEKVKWQATTVWLSEFGGESPESGDESGNEVFLSDDESDIMDLIQERLAAHNDESDDESDLLEAAMGGAASSQTLVDGLKQHLPKESHDLLSTPRDFGSHFDDFHRDESFRHEPLVVEPSVVTYRSSLGIILDVGDHVATARVYEGVTLCKVEFSSAVFYQDRRQSLGRLRERLTKGDAVSLDYMVGTIGSRREVRCDLAWQGARPTDVVHMSAAEFSSLLQMKAPVFNGGGPPLPPIDHQMPGSSHSSPPTMSLLSNEPSPASTPGELSAHEDHGLPNGFCGGNSSMARALLTGDVSNGTLHQVARMIAQELHVLQQRDRLGAGILRDASTQTSDRIVRPVL